MGYGKVDTAMKKTVIIFSVLATIAQFGYSAIENTANPSETQPVLQTGNQPGAPVSESYKVPVQGDVNGNGRFDFADVVAINKAVSDYAKFDLNKDGSVGMADVKLAFAEVGKTNDKSMDFNGNGRLDFADVVALNKAVSEVRKYDFNKDGKLNFDDVKSAFNTIGNTATAPQALGPGSGDVNGNGRVDFSDMVQAFKLLGNTAKYDLNRDGKTNMEDVKFAFSNMDKVPDMNGNGKADFADIVHINKAVAQIAALDMNKNGRLDFADIIQLWKKL